MLQGGFKETQRMLHAGRLRPPVIEGKRAPHCTPCRGNLQSLRLRRHCSWGPGDAEGEDFAHGRQMFWKGVLDVTGAAQAIRRGGPAMEPIGDWNGTRKGWIGTCTKMKNSGAIRPTMRIPWDGNR